MTDKPLAVGRIEQLTQKAPDPFDKLIAAARQAQEAPYELTPDQVIMPGTPCHGEAESGAGIPDTPLTQHELSDAMKEIPEWTFAYLDGPRFEQIRRESITLESRTAAFLFVKKLYHLAQEMDHDATINWTYHKVHISCTTHHADNRVTMHDIEAAKRIDQPLKS